MQKLHLAKLYTTTIYKMLWRYGHTLQNLNVDTFSQFDCSYLDPTLTWTLVHLVHDLKAFFPPEVLIFQNSARNNFKQNLLKNAGQLANTFLWHLYPTQFEVAAWQSNAWAVDEACLMASYGSFMRNPLTLQLYCPSNYITDSPFDRKEFMISPFIFFWWISPAWHPSSQSISANMIQIVYILFKQNVRLLNHSEVNVIWRHGILWPNPSSAVIVEAAAVDPEACVQSFLENVQGVGSRKPHGQVNAVYMLHGQIGNWCSAMQCVGRCTRNGGKVWVILGLWGTWSQVVVGWWYLLKRNPIGKNLAKVVLGGVVWW